MRNLLFMFTEQPTIYFYSNDLLKIWPTIFSSKCVMLGRVNIVGHEDRSKNGGWGSPYQSNFGAFW